MKKLKSTRSVRMHNGGFAPTFKGIVKYFASRFNDSKLQTEEVKQIVVKYGEIGEYPVFSLHEPFEEWLHKEFYSFIVSASYIVNRLFESGAQITSIKTMPPQEEEALWKETFAATFLNLILTKPKTKLKKPEDLGIQTLIKKHCRKEIARKKKEIGELKKILQKPTR